MHHAEYRCIDCDRHLGWVPKPDKPTLPEDLFEVITACTVELKRTGYTWKSERVLDFCEKACGKRSPHFLKVAGFFTLLSRLNELPTISTEQHAPQRLQK
jgi:hypothetical protein